MNKKLLLVLLTSVLLLATAVPVNPQDMTLSIFDSTVNIRDSIPITLLGLSVQSVTQSSAKITWTTNVFTNASVMYGISDSFGNNLLNSTFSNAHGVMLTGLESSRVYFYNVTSCDVLGECLTRGPYNFTTLAVVGGGGGGGGGGYELPPCKPIWYCDLWPKCINGTRSRICDDLMGCEPSKTETQDCIVKVALPVFELPTTFEFTEKARPVIMSIENIFIEFRLVLLAIGILAILSILFFVFLRPFIGRIGLEEKLLEYIKQARLRGFKDSHIIARLKKEGMKDRDIERYIKWAKKK